MLLCLLRGLEHILSDCPLKKQISIVWRVGDQLVLHPLHSSNTDREPDRTYRPTWRRIDLQNDAIILCPHKDIAHFNQTNLLDVYGYLGCSQRSICNVVVPIQLFTSGHLYTVRPPHFGPMQDNR